MALLCASPRHTPGAREDADALVGGLIDPPNYDIDNIQPVAPRHTRHTEGLTTALTLTHNLITTPPNLSSLTPSPSSSSSAAGAAEPAGAGLHDPLEAPLAHGREVRARLDFKAGGKHVEVRLDGGRHV